MNKKILLFAFIVAFLVQYMFTGTNFFEGLGLLSRDECSGALSVSNTGCVFKAKISSYDCLGKKYEVREDTCFGSLKCEGSIDYDSTQATCGWKDSAGSHNYVLCIGNKLKDSISKVC